ncbi:MAG: hypothetical protein KDC46_00740 [Thermoleophilia bacterium]|nr:hypothetical protein [Thermoleophilia bacterium]
MFTTLLLVLAALLAGGCDLENLDLSNFATVEDLSKSGDPMERGAAAAAAEADDRAGAEALVTRGLADGDLQSLRDAAAMRADDPDYDRMYLLALIVQKRETESEWRKNAWSLADMKGNDRLYIAQERALDPDATDRELSDRANRRRLAVSYQFLTSYAGPADEQMLQEIRDSYCDSAARFDLPTDICKE